MFFTTHGDMPKVERAGLSGRSESRKILVQSKQIVRPQALTLDYINEHIYWADAYMDRIERINYDGSNRQIILKIRWVGIQLIGTSISG